MADPQPDPIDAAFAAAKAAVPDPIEAAFQAAKNNTGPFVGPEQPAEPDTLSAHGITDPDSVRVTELGAVTPKRDLPNPVEGMQQFGRGFYGLGTAFGGQPGHPGETSEALRAGSDLIEGIFQMAAPLVGASAMEAPLGTAWGLLKAYVAGKAGTTAAAALTDNPDAHRFAGDLAAAISGTKSVDDFAQGNIATATKIAAEFAKAKGRALTVAATLARPGSGTGDVPGFRANPAFDESMVDRADREASQARSADLSEQATQAADEARQGQPEQGQRPPQVTPVEQVPTDVQAAYEQAKRVTKMRGGRTQGQVEALPAGPTALVQQDTEGRPIPPTVTVPPPAPPADLQPAEQAAAIGHPYQASTEAVQELQKQEPAPEVQPTPEVQPSAIPRGVSETGATEASTAVAPTLSVQFGPGNVLPVASRDDVKGLVRQVVDRFYEEHGPGTSDLLPPIHLVENGSVVAAIGPNGHIQEAAKAQPQRPLSYEDFSKQYRSAFQQASKYTPDQIGSRLHTDAMARLADAHPEHLTRLEAEEEGTATPTAPVPASTAGTPAVAYNADKHSIEVRFSEKPAPEILSGLKTDGYRWAKSNRAWYRKLTPGTTPDAALSLLRQSLRVQAPEPPATQPEPAASPEVETAYHAAKAEAPPQTAEAQGFTVGGFINTTPKGVESPHGAPTARGVDAGQLPAGAGATPERSGTSGESALGAVPAERDEGAARAEPDRAGHGDTTGVLADGVRDAVAALEGRESVAPDGGGDDPVPLAVSPSGATHDPGHPGADFDLTPAHIKAIVERGNVERLRDNLDAIDLVKQLKAEQRYATAEEQAILARYVGWGASDIAPFLNDRPRPTWSANERALWERIQKLPEAEREAMGASRLNAHYTFDLYRPIWDALVRAGFSGGRVLEPAVGTGHAFGLMPADVRAASTLTATELEPLTASIAGYLYPSATVQAVGYEKAIIARGTQDLIISNVPFGDFGVDDPLLPKFLTERIHNYFFAKALEQVRPGGLVVFVTSRYTLDNTMFARVRDYLTESADFLGAVRLPNTAFDKSAKTEVVTDLIVLRKREEGAPQAPENALFRGVSEHPTLQGETNWRTGKRAAIYRSDWYTAHPEYLLGAESLEGSQYGANEYTVTGPREGVLDAMDAALRTLLPPGTYERARVDRPVRTGKTAEAGSFKAGEYRVGEKGQIEQVADTGEVSDATPTRNGKPDAKAVARLTGMIGIRDALRETVAAMLAPEATDASIGAAQRKLTRLYGAFTKAYGYLNDPYNKRLFSADPESTNLLALERLEAKATESVRKDGTRTLTVKYDVVGKADIFSKRTLNPPAEVTRVDSPKEALLASLGQHAGIDWAYMARIAGTSQKDLQRALTAEGLVYAQPDGSHVLAEEYLSGDVVSKLEDARAANTKGRFAANIAALEAIQPIAKTKDDVETGVVSVNLGAAWVEPDDYAAFATQQLGVSAGDVHVSLAATSTLVRWSVTPARRAASASEQHGLAVKYSGGTYGFLEMFTDALNLKMPELGHYEGSGDNRVWVKEPEATLAARANVDALGDLWTKFVYAHEGLIDRVLTVYNTRYNRTVERQYDGAHMTYPGMGTLYNMHGDPLKFHPHQNNGVWRILSSGNTLLAHEVGAGKTFEMIAAAMEMRRTGRARKPMIVVPTYLLSAWRRDVMALYPNARVAAFDEKDLQGKKRQQAMARIAFGNWDIVLVPHSSFSLLKVSEQRMIDMMERWIQELKSLESDLQDEGSKAGERQRRKMEDKVRKLRDRLADRSGDTALTWEQLGVDALFIDEAHAFKNLFFYTKLENLRGLSRSESDRALDLYVKVQEINEQSRYRNLVLATATPLMNSMAEVYTMQRYLQPQTLRRAGFENFDNWYATFAHAGLATEQQPDGTYKEVRRLRQFSNLQLLSKLVRQVMDYVGWEDMPYLKLPKIAGGKIAIVQTEPHPMYPKLREWFGQRMQNIRDMPPRWDYRKEEYIAPARPDPLTGADTGRQDNILTIMNDAKKAAVDVRLVLGDRAADFKGSRLQVAADKMATLYKQEKGRKGVQLVFLDLGTPKNLKPLEFLKGVSVEDATDGDLKDEEDTVDDETEEGALLEDDSAFNLYDALKAALVKRGVPADQIAYIHQARTSAERIALFQAANEGRVRFVFASTDKGGVGMNIQTRLAAIHELDAPRAGRPGDLRQRMGRGIRQGNTYPDVHLVRYVTKGTTDEWLWGMLTTKDYQIRQFMRGDATSLTEEDPSTMSLAEAQMRASGDPRTIELVDLKGKLARLQAQASAAERALAQANADVQRATQLKAALTQDLTDLRAWLPTWHTLRGKAFTMTVGGKTYDAMKDADAALIAQAQQVAKKEADRPVAVGEVGGLPILARFGSSRVTAKDGKAQRILSVELAVDGKPYGGIPVRAVHMDGRVVEELGDGMRPAAGIVNTYEDVPAHEADLTRQIADAEAKIATAKRTLAAPPSVITAAKETAGRIAALETELKAEGEANEKQRREAKQEAARAETEKKAGPTLQSTILPGAAEFGEHVLTPAVEKVAQALRSDTGLLISLVGPAHIGVAPLAAGSARAYTAARDQQLLRVQKELAAAKRVMDGWSKEKVKLFWRVMEGQEPAQSLPRSDRQYAQTLGAVLKRWTDLIVELGLIEDYLEHYFPHEWVKGSVEGDLLRRLFGRRPMQGSEAFRKRRSIPTMEEGLKIGLEPVSWNPADQVFRKVAEMARSVRARGFRDDMKRQGLYAYVPAGKTKPDTIRDWQRIPDEALGTVYGARVPEQAYGQVIAGHYYAPREVVRLVENMISRGLHGRSVLLDTFNAAGNASTAALLGWSSMHLWLTGLEHTISKWSLAQESLARGEWGSAAKAFAQVGPHGLIRDLVRGYKLVHEFYGRDATANATAGFVGQTIQGGGGFGRSLFEAHDAPQQFMTNLRRLLGAVQSGAPTDAASAAGKALWHGAATLAEGPTLLIMNYWVPYLKAAAFHDLAQMELRRLGDDATLEDQRQVYGKAWDAVDNRFGQLRYDNLFWNNTFKQILMSLFLSVGWQVGSVRAGGGALKQIPLTARKLKAALEGGAGKPPEGPADATSAGQGRPPAAPQGYVEPWLDRDFSWMVALIAIVVTIDAVKQYLSTGLRLGEDKDGHIDWRLALRDAFAPRNGRIGPSGREERDTPISYAKDFYGWLHHPVTTTEHKLRPLLHTVAEMVENEDFYGDAIYDGTDPLGARLKDLLLYALKSAEPISYENAKRRLAEGAPFSTILKEAVQLQAVPFIPASAELERSDLEQYLHDLIPPSHRSKADAAKAAARRQMREDLRQGDAAAAHQTATEAGLSRRSEQAVRRSERVGSLASAFDRVTWPEAVTAMDLATDTERASLRGPFLRKALNALKATRSREERARIQQQRNAALKQPQPTM